MSNRAVHNEFISVLHNHCVNPRSREIFLHGYIDSNEQSIVDYAMSVQFIKNISLLDGQNKTQPIIIHMHTVGGDWDDGMAIYDAIKAVESKVVIIGHGLVASMATVIMQAADFRLLMPNASFLIHYGYMGVDDNVVAALSTAEKCKLTNNKMLDIYAERCIEGEYFINSEKPKFNTADKIKKFLDQRIKEKVDLYMTSEQAVNMGFADGLIGWSENEFTITELKENQVEIKKFGR